MTRDILIRAKARIPERFRAGDVFNAICREARDDGTGFRIVLDAFMKANACSDGLLAWESQKKRSRAEVMAAFDRAIEKAGER